MLRDDGAREGARRLLVMSTELRPWQIRRAARRRKQKAIVLTGVAVLGGSLLLRSVARATDPASEGHFESHGLAFDYPPEWTYEDPSLSEALFLGTIAIFHVDDRQSVQVFAPLTSGSLPADPVEILDAFMQRAIGSRGEIEEPAVPVEHPHFVAAQGWLWPRGPFWPSLRTILLMDDTETYLIECLSDSGVSHLVERGCSQMLSTARSS
jgi:hypothetical protein